MHCVSSVNREFIETARNFRPPDPTSQTPYWSGGDRLSLHSGGTKATVGWTGDETWEALILPGLTLDPQLALS